MADEDDRIASHTLHLLQELRAEIRSSFAAVDRRFAEIERHFESETQGLHVGLAELRAEMNRNFEVTNSMLAGEMSTRAFAFKGIEERFLANERRLTILEARSDARKT
ncbi:hypothetical protein [Prosthecomicrobium sp. N25]|uniref:hypothetical protein n=1 Tax=Prosthecomicrobium sp. N25 TaxID=3129254 RepID=UPI003076F66E